MVGSRPLLKAVAIIEKDTNNDILLTWAYPSLNDTEKECVVSKCSFQRCQFFVYHRQENWFYVLTESSGCHELRRVLTFALILKTTDFHPKKYRELTEILAKAYSVTGEPPKVLSLYLDVQCTGECRSEEKSLPFQAHKFPSDSPTQQVPVKELIKLFQLETILVYTALMLNKRIVVYHHQIEELQRFLSVLPTLMSHRDSIFDNFYPLMDTKTNDMVYLKDKTHFIAGFVDATVQQLPEMYDLVVNLSAAEITVAPHAKEAFQMSKTHKDIALFCVRLAENARLADADIIKEIIAKSKSLISSVAAIVHKDPSLSAEGAIKKAQLSSALQYFYLGIAKAEKLHN